MIALLLSLSLTLSAHAEERTVLHDRLTLLEQEVRAAKARRMAAVERCNEVTRRAVDAHSRLTTNTVAIEGMKPSDPGYKSLRDAVVDAQGDLLQATQDANTHGAAYTYAHSDVGEAIGKLETFILTANNSGATLGSTEVADSWTVKPVPVLNSQGKQLLLPREFTRCPNVPVEQIAPSKRTPELRDTPEAQ